MNIEELDFQLAPSPGHLVIDTNFVNERFDLFIDMLKSERWSAEEATETIISLVDEATKKEFQHPAFEGQDRKPSAYRRVVMLTARMLKREGELTQSS